MNHFQKHLSASLLALAALLCTATIQVARAQTAPDLGTASDFAVLGGAGVTCTASGVDGDVGSLLSVTGFPPPAPALCTLVGTVHAADATAQTAWNDVFAVGGTNDTLTAMGCDFNYPATFQLGGQTLASGVHCFASDALLNGQLNLTGNGPWILRTGTALTTGTGALGVASVLVNGEATCDGDVFWQIGSSATIGTDTEMVGNILADQSISFTGVGSSLVGRAFAKVAAVTMTGTTISIENCGGGTEPPSCDKPKHHKHHKHGKNHKHDKHDKHNKHGKQHCGDDHDGHDKNDRGHDDDDRDDRDHDDRNDRDHDDRDTRGKDKRDRD